MHEKPQSFHHLQKQVSHPIKFSPSFKNNTYHFPAPLLGQTRASVWHWDLQNDKIVWSNSMSRMLVNAHAPGKINEPMS